MKREDRAGLELTIIVHLVVLIILLLWGIGSQLLSDNSFVMDFSKQEMREQERQETEFKDEISQKLDKRLAEAAIKNPSIRNVAVSSRLRDDRHSTAEAEKLYRDAENLANELKKGFKSDIEEDAVNETVDNKSSKEESTSYSGPSVLSWTLDGRKASHLPIPAYRCYGEGTVSVTIQVSQQGKVVNAKVNEDVSSPDKCLREFAIRAARMSRFSQSPTAPVKQVGEIVYSFIAQ